MLSIFFRRNKHWYRTLFIFICFLPHLCLAKKITVLADAKDVDFLHVYYNDAFYDLKSYIQKEPDAAGHLILTIDPVIYPAMITCEYNGVHVFFLAFAGKEYLLKRDANKEFYVEESGANRSSVYQLLEKTSGSFRAFAYTLPRADQMTSVFKGSNHRKAIRDSILTKCNLTGPEKAFYKDWILYSSLNDKLLPFLIQNEHKYAYEQLPAAYLDSLGKYISFLNNDSLIANDKYRTAAFYFNKFLSRSALYQNNEFETQFENAQKNFTGATRQMILFKLLKDYIKSDIPDYDIFYKKFGQISQGSVYKKYIDSIYVLYRSSIPESVTACKLYNADNKETTLGDLLNLNKGKIIYIDMWASWCVPCKAEFYFSEKMIDKFKGQQVAFIFLSLDRTRENWQTSNSTYDFMKTGNSFWVNGDFSSPIAKNYNILSIPRYLLINADGKIIDADAKRPGDAALSDQIKHYLH